MGTMVRVAGEKYQKVEVSEGAVGWASLPISAVVKVKKKRKKKGHNSSSVCGKVGKMDFLSTFPQTV
jgi:hypothetical protein